MASQAPCHVQRLGLFNHRHAIDAAMAAHATDPRLDMSRVIEVDKVGQIVNPHPRDGLAGGSALTDQGQRIALGLDRRVAIHTGGSRRHGRLGRRFDPNVAIPTIDAQITRMQRVAVGYWLFWRVAEGGHLRRKNARDQDDDINDSA